MMKCVLALVVLLHFCYSFTLKRDVNREIIQGLQNLSELYFLNKANITSPDTIRAPAAKGRDASSCAHIFVGELNHLLNNVSVDEADKYIIDGLKANLNKMDLKPIRTSPGMDHRCNMKPETLKPFNLYVIFFRQLNKSKKR